MYLNTIFTFGITPRPNSKDAEVFRQKGFRQAVISKVKQFVRKRFARDHVVITTFNSNAFAIILRVIIINPVTSSIWNISSKIADYIRLLKGVRVRVHQGCII